METNIPGIYAAGDICTYEGKVKLIACGFGEAPTAVNNAKAYFDPNAKLQPMHSSSMFLICRNKSSFHTWKELLLYHKALNSINYRTQCAFHLKIIVFFFYLIRIILRQLRMKFQHQLTSSMETLPLFSVILFLFYLRLFN